MPDESRTLQPSTLRDSAMSRRLSGTRQGFAAFARGVAREPLVHFCILGALIFAADRVTRPPATDDHLIVVSKAMRQSFIDGFDEDKERTPNETELKNMVDAWVASEILYREGKRLGVDKGDDAIRNRIAYKLQVMIFDEATAPNPTEEELQRWFEANRDRYDQPETVSFIYTSPTDEATARKQLADIQAMQESPEVAEKSHAILDRPVKAVAISFGDAFRESLLKLPMGQWSVLQSKDGWHVVRLDARQDGKPVTLDDVREAAIKQWHTDETRKRAWEAVNKLKANYTVRWE